MSKNTKEKRSVRSPIPVGIILTALGAFFIAFSTVIEFLALAVGIFIIIGASVLGTLTLCGKKGGALFILKIILTICALTLGILTIIFKHYVAGIICIAFSCAVAIDSSAKLAMAIRTEKYTAKGKTIASIASILTVAAALTMVRLAPLKITDENTKLCSVIIGITLILDAIGYFMIPFLLKNASASKLNSSDSDIYGLKSPEEMQSEDVKRNSEQKTLCEENDQKDDICKKEIESSALEGSDIYDGYVSISPSED